MDIRLRADVNGGTFADSTDEALDDRGGDLFFRQPHDGPAGEERLDVFRGVGDEPDCAIVPATSFDEHTDLGLEDGSARGVSEVCALLAIRATTQHSLPGVFALACVADGLASVFGRATGTEERPREFATTCAKKMLRVRSHFHENNSLVLRRERHKIFEVLQYHRTSSEATPLIHSTTTRRALASDAEAVLAGDARNDIAPHANTLCPSRALAARRNSAGGGDAARRRRSAAEAANPMANGEAAVRGCRRKCVRAVAIKRRCSLETGTPLQIHKVR